MQKPSASSIIPVLIIISIISGGLYFLFKPQDDAIRQTQPPVPPSKAQTESTPSTLPLPTPNTTLPSTSNEADPGQYRKAPMDAKVADPCLDTIAELDRFFLYLDEQEYIKEYQFPNGSKDFIASMINKALAHPPTPQADQDIESQIKTGAYLYRLIGGQNLLIMAKVLSNEPDQLESIFANFYNWSLLTGQCPNRTYAIRPQLDQLYRYALFFINTTGGQRYVTRRDSMTGLLTRFYAVQIIIKAKNAHIDTINIDLTPHITALITDIESTDLLEQKSGYLKTLYAFRDK